MPNGGVTVNKQDPYFQAVAKKFLEGTNFRAPVEAVESGERTILEWCDMLEKARAESGDAAKLLTRENLIVALLKTKPRTVKELAALLALNTELISKSVRSLADLGRVQYLEKSFLIESLETESEEMFGQLEYNTME